MRLPSLNPPALTAALTLGKALRTVRNLLDPKRNDSIQNTLGQGATIA